MRHWLSLVTILTLSSGSLLSAQAAAPVSDARDHSGEHPDRRPGHALLQLAALNLTYGLGNLVRGQVTARVTPASWWYNLQRGWEWDLDRFLVNQIGHPYQGSHYFAAGRANGLGFYESAALTALGSGTWEYFGETNHPSLNDFLNTTLGGVALGEMLHRTAWLVRNPRGDGRMRRWRSIAAGAVDPVSGLNIAARGEAPQDDDGFRTHIGGIVSAGLLRRGSNRQAAETTVAPFLQVDLAYGDTGWERSRTPFDAFDVRFMAGGGGGLSEARVKGRLVGQPLLAARIHFSVVQTYHYLGNDAYRFGAQAFEAHVRGRRTLPSRLAVDLETWGGLTVLGAVDSRALERTSPSPQQGQAGQGVSVGPRNYDYGPGTTFGVATTLMHRGQPFINAQYEGRTLYSLDGVRANHVLQRARLDLLVPLRGRMGLGATGEFFDRHSFYQDAAQTKKRYDFPQGRLYLTWRLP